MNILECERAVGTTEHHTQLQRHLEILQHWGKGPRDITQLGLALNHRRPERELRAFLLTGQDDGGAVELQHRALLLDGDIADMSHTIADAGSQAQVLHIEACHTVSCHKLRQLEVHGIPLQVQMIQQQLCMGDDVNMTGIKEASLRPVGILSRQVVVDSEMQTVEDDLLAIVFSHDAHSTDADAPRLRTFLRHGLHLSAQMTDLALMASRPETVVGKPVHIEGIRIEDHVDPADLRIPDLKREPAVRAVLFHFLFLRLALLLVTLEGIDHKLEVAFLPFLLVQTGLHPLQTGIGDLDVIPEDAPTVKIDGQALHVQHLSMFPVLNIQTIQPDIKLQEIDVYAVNAYLRLQFLLKQLRRMTQHLLLERTRIKHQCCGQQ